MEDAAASHEHEDGQQGQRLGEMKEEFPGTIRGAQPHGQVGLRLPVPRTRGIEIAVGDTLQAHRRGARQARDLCGYNHHTVARASSRALGVGSQELRDPGGDKHASLLRIEGWAAASSE